MEIKCKKHPKYEGKNPPRKTKKYPEGCPKCWRIYYEKISK